MGNSEYEEALKEGKDCNEHEEECSEHHQEMVFHSLSCISAKKVEDLCFTCLKVWEEWREGVRKNV